MKTNSKHIRNRSLRSAVAITCLMSFLSVLPVSALAQNGQCYESADAGWSRPCTLTAITVLSVTIGYACGGTGTCTDSSVTTYHCVNCSFLESLCNCSVVLTNIPVVIWSGSCSGSVNFPLNAASCSCSWNGISLPSVPTTIGILNWRQPSQAVCFTDNSRISRYRWI
jgi:hypothetical protein